MNLHLQPARQWAQQEFGSVQLHDARYAKRLVKIADKLAAKPGGTLPQAFPDWAELKGAYRFFTDARNSFERIQSGHRQRVFQDCCTAGEYLLIEDTSGLDFTGRCCEDMGYTNPGGRGFFLHTTLAVRVEAWDLNQRPEGVVLGVLSQQCWNRPVLDQRPEESRRQMQERQRESDRWGRVLLELPLPPRARAQCRWVLVGDREADFYEPIQRCQSTGADFVIRAFHDRCLAGESGHYLEALAQAPVAGTLAVELRARPGMAARTAVVEVRTLQVTLRGPYRGGQKMADFTVNAIEVRENLPPEAVTPLRWVLLTSLDCGRWSEVQRVIGRYSARWWVEEYHKALKTGAGVEDSQLEQQYRIESLVAVLAIVAVRLLNLKFLARARPEEPVDVQVFGTKAIQLLEKRFGPPAQGQWTHRQLVRAMARMGGFIGRRGDGEPGWQTIWRGWQRLIWMTEGAELIRQH
jgi:Transposase DNA-binding/Transposase Tn5 dimerisation domain